MTLCVFSLSPMLLIFHTTGNFGTVYFAEITTADPEDDHEPIAVKTLRG